MILLNGFLHRDRLAWIIDHWVVSQPGEPLYASELKQIINFNAYAGCLILDAFAHALFVSIHGEPIHSLAAMTKGQLKEFLVERPEMVSPRVKEMVDRYQRYPEDYYRETPIIGRIYYRGEDDFQYFGSTRVKRFHRIAEKASRYLIDFIFEEVKERANSLAVERAKRFGVPVAELETAADEQVEEFLHAERRLRKAIRTGQFIDSLPLLSINDILGVKVVVRADEMEQVIAHLDQGSDTDVVERETHIGNYNATNLIVRYRWPKDAVVAHPFSREARAIFRSRGFTGNISQTFHKFIKKAEDEVLVEVILTTYEEMLESEIGRCMHEERILSQRQNQPYHGSVAQNVEYLMDYIFRFALSPISEQEEVPIRLWMKYMPDYIDQLHRRLSNVSAETDFTEAIFED